MGAGASVLRQDLGEHTSIERHIRLNRPGLPFHDHVIIVSVSRIPEVEVDVLDRVLAGNVRNFGHISDDEDEDYDYDYEYDYDAEEEAEEEVTEWLRVTRF